VGDSGRIGLVLHPARDCSGAAGQIAAWTRAHDVDLVAAAADAARLQLPGGQ
jgi:NAD+ kinase